MINCLISRWKSSHKPHRIHYNTKDTFNIAEFVKRKRKHKAIRINFPLSGNAVSFTATGLPLIYFFKKRCRLSKFKRFPNFELVNCDRISFSILFSFYSRLLSDFVFTMPRKDSRLWKRTLFGNRYRNRAKPVWLTMTLMVFWECNVHRMKQLKICLLLQREKSFNSIVNAAV